MNTLKHAMTASLIVSALCASGCSPVAPWQRGNLAKPQMAIDTNPQETKYYSHIYGSREATTGSSRSSAGGGGCGCY